MAVAQVHLLGVPYTADTENPQLQFDAYFYPPQQEGDAGAENPRGRAGKGFLVFVHGGAWRSYAKPSPSLVRGLGILSLLWSFAFVVRSFFY